MSQLLSHLKKYKKNIYINTFPYFINWLNQKLSRMNQLGGNGKGGRPNACSSLKGRVTGAFGVGFAAPLSPGGGNGEGVAGKGDSAVEIWF